VSKNSLAKKILIAVIVIALIAASIVYLILNRKNIHLIESRGKSPMIFRSAQLKNKDFRKLIEDKNIKVVLNLRGVRNDSWYYSELATTEEMNIEYYSYGFSDDNLPSKKLFLDILDLFDYVRDNDLPLLIHCKAGADRAGMMSAIIQMYLYGFEYKDAVKSLSWRYGHIPNTKSPLEKLLKEYSKVEDKLGFREWITEFYKHRDFVDKDKAS
jgi:protein tyrosine/serine phosphatase